MKNILTIILCLIALGVFAQGTSINSTGAPADPSAILDVSSTNQGVVFPRMTTAERDAISNPTYGLMILNRSTDCFNIFMGSWREICPDCPTPAIPGSITGDVSACSNASGIAYSIAAVAGATGYSWSVPSGASITSGQGTTSITVDFGSTSGNVSVSATNACGASAASSLTVTLAGGGGSQTFTYTGSSETFTVPNCVTQITVDVYGAKGHETPQNIGYAGRGGQAKGTLNVTPGQTLYIYVGQDGTDGGWNGGEANTNSWGGGASDIRIGGTTLNDRVVVAAGGGAAGNKSGCSGTGTPIYGGDGGPNVGGTGDNASNSTAGTGGTQSAGGNGGTGNSGGGQPGSFGVGGAGFNTTVGGGGGGWYGGGGGGYATSCNASGGGGGSNYVGGLNTVLENNGGVQAGDGQIIISW